MSNTDRIALDRFAMWSKTKDLYRVICGVCDRKGQGGFLGYLNLNPADPAGWIVFVSTGRIGKVPARGEIDTFGRSAISRSWSGLDVPLRPRCAERHHLKVLHSEDVIAFVQKAQIAQRDFVVIPE